MTIVEAAQAVLKDAKTSMHVNEIYDEIIRRGLYTFGAKNPKSVLSQMMREKSTANPKAQRPIFQLVAERTYELHS